MKSHSILSSTILILSAKFPQKKKKNLSEKFMASCQFLFAVMHFILLFFSSSALHGNLTDISALLAFKEHVGDPEGILSRNWTTNTSFCTWTGVSCSHRRQRVVVLDIENFSLRGTISPHIANMSFLSYLNLANNSLAGHIPDSLSQLRRLKTLILSDNQLSGSIPFAIFNMSFLTVLHLYDNNLSGTLPSNSSLIPLMLPRLQDLSLTYNQLSGNIPSSLSHCQDLRYLLLPANQFIGDVPSELGNLKKLRVFELAQNNLTGTIPTSLGNLTSLLKLTLSSNNFHGGIPEELGGLANLQFLILDSNYGITGPIPTSLSNISSLEALDLAANSLTGTVRLQLGGMPHLRILFLGANKLTGGLDFLTQGRVLESVDLAENELVGFLTTVVANLSTNLQLFQISSNHIKGKIPIEVGNLTSLSTLALGENELVGTIPSEILMLESLQWLELAGNRLHGSIPSELGRLTILNELFLDRNRLSGSIPESMGNLSRLQYLLLNANALSSGIPQRIWSLSNLIELDMSRNNLSGFLSSNVGNMTALDTLDVSVNQLSGDIPSSLMDLQMLSFLDLSNNSFEGSIPQSFNQLISITVLDLSCNSLSGVIPDSLATLRHLSRIDLSFNKLEGKIPNGGAFLIPNVTSLVGNAALCGAPRLGFPSCPTNATGSNSGSTRLRLLKYILPPVAFIVILIACVCIFLKTHQKQTKVRAPTSTSSPDNHRLISYHELVRATGNFSEANLLGKGSFGSVYKGCLDDGLLAAIKVLNLEVDGASRSFDVECSALRMVRHRNLVKIISTCSNLDFKALILQFMPNGSLERWLYSHNYLNLLQRINIIIDVASALDHLHHHHSQVVLHCDLKPSNILLDEDMTAHVSDFGIAKLLVGDTWSVTSASTPGTIGYIAPEYASTGRVSRKGDVYSFGILLLEIFTRKKPTDPIFNGELSLRQWVCKAYPSALLEIVDYNLLKDGSRNERPREDLTCMHAFLSSIIELGIICSRDSPKERLTMKEVVPRLQKIKKDCLSMFPDTRSFA